MNDFKDMMGNDRPKGRAWIHSAHETLKAMEDESERLVASGKMPQDIADALYLVIDTMIEGFISPSRQARKEAISIRDELKKVVEAAALPNLTEDHQN